MDLGSGDDKEVRLAEHDLPCSPPLDHSALFQDRLFVQGQDTPSKPGSQLVGKPNFEFSPKYGVCLVLNPETDFGKRHATEKKLSAACASDHAFTRRSGRVFRKSDTTLVLISHPFTTRPRDRTPHTLIVEFQAVQGRLRQEIVNLVAAPNARRRSNSDAEMTTASLP